MGRRMFALVALVAGLALLLALAVAVQAAEVVRTDRPSPNTVPAGLVTSLTDPHNLASVDYTSGLAITPALTAYLPMLYWGYPPCAVAPALTSPANKANLDTRIPLFAWDSRYDPGATELHLDIWRNPELTDWAYGLRSDDQTQGTQQWRIDVNLSPSTTYYWRAYLMCGSTQGPHSEVWSFTTGSGGTTLPGPDLLSPADGSNVCGALLPAPDPGGGSQCFGGATLQWSPVTGATGYRVDCVYDREHETIIVAGSETKVYVGWADTGYAPHCPGSCGWWVQARNDYAWGEESERWDFDIFYR
jgi:hypothetical protein